jgi:hypothetical protein
MHQPCTKVGKQQIIKVGNLSNGSQNRESVRAPRASLLHRGPSYTILWREFRLRPLGKGGL